jgi:hypothetical protein
LKSGGGEDQAEHETPPGGFDADDPGGEFGPLAFGALGGEQEGEHDSPGGPALAGAEPAEPEQSAQERAVERVAGPQADQQTAPRLVVGGVHPQRFEEVAPRPGEIALFEKRIRAGVMADRGVGFEPGKGGEGGPGLFVAAEFGEDGGPVVEAGRVFRVEGESGFGGFQGLIPAGPGGVDAGEERVVVGILRRQPDGFPGRLGRRAEFAAVGQDDAEGVVGVLVVGADLDRLPGGLEGFLGAVEFGEAEGEESPAEGVFGVEHESGPHLRGGLLGPPGGLEVEGALEVGVHRGRGGAGLT